MADKKKIRVELRKNRGKPPRSNAWTQQFAEHGFEHEAPVSDERVRSKGDLSRHRTILQGDAAGDMPAASAGEMLPGRVIRVHGLQSVVQTADGTEYRCAVRRLLKSLVTDERNVVTCGDRVHFRPAPGNEGMIESVEPRHGILTRESRRKEHVLVANVDQVVIVMSLVQPDLKPHLIDRYLASAFIGKLDPIIVLNKADLAEAAPLQSLIGSYSQMGIPTLLCSAKTGQGIDRLKRFLADKSTVFSGQSGVGKSSLLNAVEPDLALRVSHVSGNTNKGRHTTTTSELIRLQTGGYVVDTPGIRQMQIWDIIPGEVEGFFPEFHPFIPHCGFPDCTHTHEEECALKKAAEQGLISPRRFHSYLGIYGEAMERKRF